jgi:hypothetical protein
MQILILGDSWAADWSSQYDQYQGWPNLLAEQYNITNIAQAGVCQYSINQQLHHTDISGYDTVIVSITSPYRLYTPQHPVHTTGLHANSDLIYTDLEYHLTEQPHNKQIQSAIGFYQHHFDTAHAEYVHELLVTDLLNHLDHNNTIVTSNIAHNCDVVPDRYTYVEGHSIYQSYPGKINHMNEEGNQLFANSIQSLL